MTLDEAKKQFSYDPETGVLTRIGYLNKWAYVTKGKHIGKPAGYQTGGYLQIGWRNKTYKVHRIAWLLTHGEWPDGQIDHINGIKDDNRLCNLRDVSHSENQRNQSLFKRNTTGVIGVTVRSDADRYPRGPYYMAQINVGGSKKLYSGYDFFEAVCARKSAENRYGFHQNHGRTATGGATSLS